VKIVCKIAAGLALGVLPLLAAAAPLPASAAAAASTASAAGPELAAFKKAIRSKYDLKERAFAAHDPAPILEHFYTADVISVGEGEGRRLLVERFSGTLKRTDVVGFIGRNGAGKSAAPIGVQLFDEAAALATRVSIIAKARTARLDRFSQHVHDRIAEQRSFLERNRRRRTRWIDP